MKSINACFFAMLLIAGSCSSPKPTQPPGPNPAIDSLFEAYNQFKLRINPIEATKAGESEYNDKVANFIADDYQADLIENYTNFLEALSEFDSTMVSPSQWMSMQVMAWDCKIKREGLTNTIVTMASPIYNLPNFELMPILQIQSLHLYFSQLAGGQSVQPFNTVKDYDNWLKRIDAYLPFLDTCVVKMREGIATGIVPPKTLIKKTIPQLDGFINDPLSEHLYYAPIRQMPESFSSEEKERLASVYSDAIQNKLKPKYKELQDFLVNSYLSAGMETSGLGALPNGPETYNYLLRLHTTTNLTADEIHELGKSEVKRILAEMEKAKAATGFEGDMKAFFEHVRTSKSQMPYTEPEQVIASFNTIRTRVEARLVEVFDLKPKATFDVRRTEAFREASASAEYVPGSKDATRPGTFYVPIPDVTSYNKFSDEALFLHEAVPGHHYQLSLQQENADLPEFLHPESLGVFVEGWALYAESLGKELGLYEDPYQYFGMLSMEMHRAIRLVVDTGIHAKGWTREQAIQYSLDNEAESEASIIASIERYMATPGQAVSYKIGQLKIQELRKKAEATLGDKFSIREFHNQVLNSGSLPLVLLEKKINGWIEKIR
ncbi:DUF885 domain-containing protein [uncultured Imperialibacter sp.]|uniref:DUF885 domain-containing protein n=1 Tax=uncultured Imperialibacter sp. TaxID=1672639 RepID=UPI0030DD0149|tara:strand:+ start:22729 stop:24546 length:1818 start_codon:yes stop_codon:yes gene_type:complete